jgi:hypothetical protein
MKNLKKQLNTKNNVIPEITILKKFRYKLKQAK